jgi:hypothetical protein
MMHEGVVIIDASPQFLSSTNIVRGRPLLSDAFGYAILNDAVKLQPRYSAAETQAAIR